MDGLYGQERLWGGKQSQQISDKADTHKAWGRDLEHNIEEKGLLVKDLGDNGEPLMVSQQRMADQNSDLNLRTTVLVAQWRMEVGRRVGVLCSYPGDRQVQTQPQ